LAAVVLVAVAGIAYSLLRGEELRTRTGLPLYYGASVTSAGGVEENLSGQGAEVEAYRVRAPAEEVYSWTEAKMAEEGWTKEGSERGGEVWFQYWRKGETMVVVAVGPGVRLGLGGENFVMYISGPYASLGSVELKPIVAPPSVSTLQATGVLSDRATLNASVSRGGYGSVRIRFWWRKAGGSWRSTPWENCSSSSYSFDLSGLEPGTLYEFRACVGFDGREDNGAVLDFRTAAPSLQAPTLSSPPNGATGVSTTPTLSWSPVAGALSYHLQLSTSPDFSAPLDFVITGPPLTISERLAEDTTYYWRVRAEGSAGFSSWSSTYSFTTALVYRLREWKLLERWSFNWGYEAFPAMSMAAYIASDGNVCLSVAAPSDTIHDGEWEYRGMTAGGTVVGSWVAGSGELREGASVTLTALKTYVDAGQLRVGDKVQIRHKPSGHVYDVPIAQGYTVGQNDMGSGSDAGNTFSTALFLVTTPVDGLGYLDSYDTEDYYKFYVPRGLVISATLSPPTGGEFALYLYDPNQVLVASAVTEELSYLATTSGYYYLRVYRFSGSGIYSLSIWTGFYGSSLNLENVENGRTTIVIRHIYGPKALDVVENTGTTFVWKNLELRVNGVIVPASNIVTFISEGVNAIGAGTGTYSMEVGDMMRVTYPAGLKIGDVVSLKWVPANQPLVEMWVTY